MSLALLGMVFNTACESEEDVRPTDNKQLFSEQELEASLNTLDLSEINDEALNGKSGYLTFAPVVDPINQGEEVGKSLLLRRKKGLAAVLKSNLVPNHAYTLWWIIWNYPQNCETPGACGLQDLTNPIETGLELIYVDGAVPKRNGVGYFKGMLKVGDTEGSINDLLGLEPIGLINPFEAQIDLAIRSHGPVIPGQVEEQISSYAGGCSVFFDPFTEIPDAVGECGEIQAAVHFGK